MPTTRTHFGRDLEGRIVAVEVEGERIKAVRPAVVEDPPLIAPPLVDLQQNGALGHSFNRLHEDDAALQLVAAHLRRHGVGRVLATFSTHPYELQLESLAVFNRIVSVDRDLARLYFGAFFEGIYISPEYGWRGAHNPQYVREPRWEEWARLQEAAGGHIRMFNVDPGRPGAIGVIEQAVRSGIRVAMGHCGPPPEVIRRAADAGADLVTHFGNGAPPQVHRHHNPFWTWLVEPRLRLGLIADGHHLPPDLIRTAFAAKGRDKVFPVSDASGHSGQPPGDYDRFIIEPDGRCHLKGEDLLAGNWHQADRNVEHLCDLGWTLEEAWRQQSLVPAQVIGITLPALTAGEPAEFVLARWTPTGLRLEQVVSLGRELLDAPIHPRMV